MSEPLTTDELRAGAEDLDGGKLLARLYYACAQIDAINAREQFEVPSPSGLCGLIGCKDQSAHAHRMDLI